MNTKRHIQKKVWDKYPVTSWVSVLCLITFLILLITAAGQDRELAAGHNNPPQMAGIDQPAAGHIFGHGLTRENLNHGLTRINTDWLDKLIERIWLVESGGRMNPPDGDGGEAIGPLQIHKEVLVDINNEYGTNFTVEDCRDIEKARTIARLYIIMWLDCHKEEIAARIFNGGPRGWEKPQTRAYYEKIKIATEDIYPPYFWRTENTEVKE